MPETMLITADELAALQAAGLGDLGSRLLQRIEQDRHEIDWCYAKPLVQNAVERLDLRPRTRALVAASDLRGRRHRRDG